MNSIGATLKTYLIDYLPVQKGFARQRSEPIVMCCACSLSISRTSRSAD